jgi:hypothetical protein
LHFPTPGLPANAVHCHVQVERVVAAAAQPVSLLHRARYVRLQQLEQQLEMVEGSLELWQQQQHSSQQQREQAKSVEAVAAVQQAAALAAVTEAAAAEQLMADNQQQQQQQQQMSWTGSAGFAATELQQALAAFTNTAPAAAGGPSPDITSCQHRQHTQTSQQSSSSSSSIRVGDSHLSGVATQQQQQQQHSEAVQDVDSWRCQTWRPHSAGSTSAAGLEAAAAAADPSGLLAALGPEAPPADTFRRLRHVLETYTDVTRYPM